MEPDDRELLERIHRGDAESFGTLYDRTRGWLLTFVIAPRIGRDDAEDVLAETFQVALGQIQGFRWTGVGLLHWLAAIARRKTHEHLRSRARNPAALEDFPSLFEVPDGAPTAEAEMIRKAALAEMQGRVAAVFSRIPDRYAEVLKMRLVEGVPRQECAGRMGVTPATFDVVLYRATRAFEREWSRR
jgi:RNA polymerase sigma-70 factor (ECF subfamily)